MDIVVSEDIDAGFIECIEDILYHREYQKLTGYVQHRNSTRFMHCLNVAYLSWQMARKTGCNERTAARVGMLHDFCLYDFSEKAEEAQVFHHPKVAAEMSREYFEISEKERQAILAHMFPLGPLPTSREAWIVSCADKLCALTERFRIDIALTRKKRIVGAA